MQSVKNPHLISVDELRAAGALDVPAAWRNSLYVEPDLFSGFIDEEETFPDNQDSSPSDEEDGRESEEQQA